MSERGQYDRNSASDWVDEAVAGEVVDMLSRRDDLRARAVSALSGRLSGTDVAVLVGIGLLGALPTSPVPSLPPGIQTAIGHAVSLRDLLTTQLGGVGAATAGLAGVFEHLSQAGGVGGFAAALVGGSNLSSMLLPDFEDVFESVGTMVLTDWWCSRQGWVEGDQVFHEAKALAYAVTAVGGAVFNPDPIALGLAGWHFYKAFEASRCLTRDLVELSELAIAGGKQASDAFDREVHRSVGVDTAVRGALLLAPRFGDDDDAFAAALTPDSGRGMA